MSERLSERAWALINGMLSREFEHLVDYVLENDTDEEFLLDCDCLDEIAKLCGVDRSLYKSFHDSGIDVVKERNHEGL